MKSNFKTATLISFFCIQFIGLNSAWSLDEFATPTVVETLQPTHLLDIQCLDIPTLFEKSETGVVQRKISIFVQSKVSLKADGTVHLPFLRANQSARVTSGESTLLHVHSDSLVHIDGKGIRPVSELTTQFGFISAGLMGIYHGNPLFSKERVLNISIGNYFLIPQDDGTNAQLNGVLNLRINETTGLSNAQVSSVLTTIKKVKNEDGTITSQGHNQMIAFEGFSQKKCEIGRAHV